MKAIIPYLNFNGDASEALDMYHEIFGGEIVARQTFGEADMKTDPQFADRIMHGYLKSDDLHLMLGDTMDEKAPIQGNNVTLSMDFDSEEAIDSCFRRFTEHDSEVTMPLEKTFWNAMFGMLTDKFGVHWLFNYDLPEEN